MDSSDLKKHLSYILWWGGVVGLIALSQLRIESLLYQLENGSLSFLIKSSENFDKNYLVSNFVSPLRGITLWISLLLVITPLINDIRKSLADKTVEIKPQYLLQTAVIFAVLFFSFDTWGLSGLAQEYADTSLSMFSKLRTVSYHQRFLMPAIANLLFFRGHYWYLIFSYICVCIFFFMIVLWFHSNKISFSFWKVLSLGTLSFMSFQLVVLGYPDVLVGTFILATFIFNLSTQAKLTLFTLSLVSHEASLIIWFPLALILFDKKEFLQFLTIVAIYIFMLLSINTSFSEVLASRDVGGTSSLQWVFSNLDREILGILFGFKALWLVVIGAAIYLFNEKMHIVLLQIIGILGAGVFMTLLGVDTSRLFSWAFMAVLLSWKILQNAGGKWEKLLNIALAINLLVPPVYVQLVTEPSIVPSIYTVILSFR